MSNINFQQLRARTPMKPYMLPLTRNDISSKKPRNMLSPSSSKRCVRTAKKQELPFGKLNRCHSLITPFKPSAVKPPLQKTFVVPSNSSYMHQTIESIDNNTFSILNCSSSTEVEGPNLSQYQNLPSAFGTSGFSPFFRQIENTIDAKFNSFIELLDKGRKFDSLLELTQLQNTIKRAIKSDANETISSTIVDTKMVRIYCFI